MRYGARGLRGVLGSAWGGEQHGNRKVGRAVPGHAATRCDRRAARRL